MNLGKLALRGVIGPLFVGHGTQKLFGWFGGHGLDGTAGFFESGLQLRPGKRHATAAGMSEALGGALITLGAATPVAASMIMGTMTTAIRKVHAPNGPWVSQGGWEYNAVLIAALTVIAEQGPGPVSLDHLLGAERSGPAWGLGALALGVAASFATVELAHRSAPAVPTVGPASEEGLPEPTEVGDPVTAG
jgi:putative oxidoreductase